MGERSLILCLLAACGGGGGTPTSTLPVGSGSATTGGKQLGLSERVAADFETAVKTSKDAYVGLFEFSAVGEFEILLHRYDLNGRLKNLTDDQKKQFLGEDGTPYPAARERRNVGNFYKVLAQRTIGTGGCTAGVPRTNYGKLLGKPFDPLPATSEVDVDGEHKSVPTPPGYEILRTHANEWLAKGGVVGIRCSGGTGGLAVVFTQRPGDRGYDLITIYDD